jgi:diguanylate cyclase (GGDEF)-like protein
MHLDVATLSVVTVFVMALLGALLLFAGLQNRSIRAPLWWGAAQIAGAAGLGLATPSALPAFVSVDIANALVLLAYGLTWAGARDFDGRKVLPLVVFFAPVVWLFACRSPAFESNADLRAMVVYGITAMLAAATAEELWRGRAEPLLSRWPTVIVLLAYAAVLLARIPATFFSPMLDDGSLLSGLSFALLAFGTLLFTVVMSFLLLNMTKERTELQHKINAMVDPLSGVANRRAFLEGARRLLVQQAIDGEPLAMMLFDLDHFKDINDRLGHVVGDRVLQTFAAASTATLGADILFGRIGGEEFAALFPVGDLGEAYAVADRVRRNFIEAAARFANGGPAPTVSAGVTIGMQMQSGHANDDNGKSSDFRTRDSKTRDPKTRDLKTSDPKTSDPKTSDPKTSDPKTSDPKTRVDTLLEVADRALYRAKANGRNRVEATASLEEMTASLACAPSIVPLIKAERLASSRARAWHRRQPNSIFDAFPRKALHCRQPAAKVANRLSTRCVRAGDMDPLTITNPEGSFICLTQLRRSPLTLPRSSSAAPVLPSCSVFFCSPRGRRSAFARWPGGASRICWAASRLRSGASRT